jgi:superfamily II DNA or RNA helicase
MEGSGEPGKFNSTGDVGNARAKGQKNHFLTTNLQCASNRVSMNPRYQMSLLTPIEAFDSFQEVRDFPAAEVTPKLIRAIQALDEREELEPILRAILTDVGQTPHGPAEIADILTHKLSANGQHGLAAFILKGRSFQTIRPKDVAHQIYRLEKIAGLKFAVFAAPGTILDAAKEQFCGTCERLRCRYSIFDATDLARLFVAHGFFCPRDAKRISGGRCNCGYSPKKRILNLVQKEAIQNLSEAHALGQKAGLVILPPGSGKTRIAAEDAKQVDANRVLYVAHTDEILEVAQSEFEAKFGAGSVTRLKSPISLRQFNRVNVTTIQLLAHSLQKVPADQFDYVVIDEFHHAAAKSYRRLIERLRPSFLLGLTATPFRGDRQDILQLCSGIIIINYELRFGIESGVLTPYHYYGCFDDVDYSQITRNGVSYSIRDLERSLIIPERGRAIVRKWREKADGKLTVAFCCTIKHAERVKASFEEEGVSAAVYTSDMDRLQRKRALSQFKQGAVKVLCVVDVLNEGADLPFVECLLFLRPTESKRIFYQQLGRGLRKFVGKSHCIVIDFIGNFKNAYKVVEYQGLLPFAEDEQCGIGNRANSRKEVLNLPLGCEVHLDDRVIEIFAQQTFKPEYATRHNIGRILLYQYDRLAWKLGRPPTKNEIDRHYLVNSDIYAILWGSWAAFQQMATKRFA